MGYATTLHKMLTCVLPLTIGYIVDTEADIPHILTSCIQRTYFNESLTEYAKSMKPLVFVTEVIEV